MADTVEGALHRLEQKYAQLKAQYPERIAELRSKQRGGWVRTTELHEALDMVESLSKQVDFYIDQIVHLWHGADAELAIAPPLHEALGWTRDEYFAWVQDPANRPVKESEDPES